MITNSLSTVEQPSPVKQPSPGGLRDASLPRLLLIEDSPVQAREIQLFLEAAGYDVAIACDAETAYDRLREQPFDLVLSDLQLPGESGFDVCRRVKAGEFPGCVPPLILMTRWSDPLNVLHGLVAGADGFISKGQDPAEIIRRVRRVLGRHQATATAPPTRTVAAPPARVMFLNTAFELTADREQLLEVLLSGFEDTIHLNQTLEREVQERLRAEAARREKEAEIRSILRAAADAIITCDERGIVESLNPSAEQMFGRPAAELLGKSIARLFPRSPAGDGHVAAAEWLHQVVETARDGRHEVAARRHDGSEFPVELSFGEVELRSRRLYTAIIRDITDRRRAEEELEQFAAELQRSNGELEQFAYVVSHDLKEPLRMVSCFTALLAEEFQPLLSEETREYVYFITDGARRMAQLIDDLLNYSRIGRGDDCLADVDLGKVAEQVLEDLRVAKECAAADIVINPLPEVHGSPLLLRQLLQNLIGNALKFHGAQSPLVIVSCDEQQDSWQLSVADNGIGIPPEQLQRVFQIFQRLHTREKYDGTGIGLAICEKIVHRHGGRIWIESVVGQGTTFFCTLSKRTPPPSYPVPNAEEAALA